MLLVLCECVRIGCGADTFTDSPLHESRTCRHHIWGLQKQGATIMQVETPIYNDPQKKNSKKVPQFVGCPHVSMMFQFQMLVSLKGEARFV